MAGKCNTLPVSEAPLTIIDGDRGVNYPKLEDFSPSGDCLFLNAGNVTSTGFCLNNLSFVTKEKDAALRKGKLQRHDVVLTTRGTVGNVALFDETIRFHDIRINSGMVILRAEQSKLWPKYLYHYFKSPLFREQVNALTTGSAQPQLPIRDICRIEIPIPPLPEQKRIAHILGTLDDKIELNRRMNETLEGMAQALFKSWFIDFDPVIDNILVKNMAKCSDQNQPSPNLSQRERDVKSENSRVSSSPAGRGGGEGSIFDGIPDEFTDRAEVRRQALADGTGNRETAKHFPATFKLTEELGWIPKGWGALPFGDLLENTIGGDWGKESEDGKHTVSTVIIRGTDIPDLKNGNRSSAPERWVESKKFLTRQLQDGDIVIEVSGGSPTQPTGRSLFITTNIIERLGGNAVPASFCRRFRPITSAHGLYGSLHLSKIYEEGKMWEYQNQSTGISNFQTSSFLKREYLAFPENKEVLNSFEAQVRPFIDKATANQQEYLIQLRDTLLPKLISGELRVSDM